MNSTPRPVNGQYDVLIIGAGLSGFPDWRIRLLEAGTDVGGVWYWNRYPGCQIDTESVSYSFSFDKELLQEWQWKDTFAFQPDTQRYIRRVAEKHDLYRDMQFSTRVKSAWWDDSSHAWTFVDERGEKYVTRFFVSCLGFLSNPTLPAIPGIQDFAGQAFHTSRWPKDVDIHRDSKDKRIGIIGTGATGIQCTTALSKLADIKSLTVFQRTANWAAPLRNETLSPEQAEEIKTTYDDVFALCAKTPAGFCHQADLRNTFDVTPSERLALYEKTYSEPGFSKCFSLFKDTYSNRAANDVYTAFIASKIRERVHDPDVAESLIPKDHGFGWRRVPLESGYYEAFNQPQVHLVDLRKTPIERITRTGIQTTDGTVHELDVLIYATGFDAITGAFNAIDWHAKDGRPLIAPSPSPSSGIDDKASLQPIWPDHRPSTFLGIHIPSLPNTFVVLGPHQPFGNATRSIERTVGVIADLLVFCAARGYTYVEPRTEAVERWTRHVVECSRGSLAGEVDSWQSGVNGNVEGKTRRAVVRYVGSGQEFERWCEECREGEYGDLILKKSGEETSSSSIPTLIPPSHKMHRCPHRTTPAATPIGDAEIRQRDQAYYRDWRLGIAPQRSLFADGR
ncbi:cyclohexanone monooxygenase [Byssothecium circinans]|uniref:Cyclohexanone monooxygenase n=1 Tax=Byssothecium circinans TaxID=147558 RepID=A0A6A5TEX0_9PLEO|nr:cyclohexanone monooxygenase [Byssothecium circinans]KAF1950868.1 cyclohexanone monooxygenase [Byssothecium circinans]